ncbi:MAG: MerR family transcriptional regulator [Bergeyella sp.]|nr:MerR family transcriptional regulator [Bergeyella sp.]
MQAIISKEELIKLYEVEVSFLDALEESGLVEILVLENKEYLHYDHLPAFEKLVNWHYDLDINIPGLEVISHLTRKIEELQKTQRSATQSSKETNDFFCEEAEYV